MQLKADRSRDSSPQTARRGTCVSYPSHGAQEGQETLMARNMRQISGMELGCCKGGRAGAEVPIRDVIEVAKFGRIASKTTPQRIFASFLPFDLLDGPQIPQASEQRTPRYGQNS